MPITQPINVTFDNKKNNHLFSAITVLSVYQKKELLIVISELTRRTEAQPKVDELKSDEIQVEVRNANKPLKIKDYGIIPEEMHQSSKHLKDVKEELKDAEHLFGKDIRENDKELVHKNVNMHMVVSLHQFHFLSLQWMRQFFWGSWFGHGIVTTTAFGMFAVKSMQEKVGHIFTNPPKP